jgi:hypothetical protein
VERIRTRTCEVDLMRATNVARYDARPGVTLRDLAARATDPWPGILRDHHDRLAAVVAEIEVATHRNAAEARIGLESLRRDRVVAAVPGGGPHDGGGRADLNRLARGAAFEAVLGTAARLRMPDLLDFLR